MNMQSIATTHASQVADLHIQGISTGFISSLGPRFVTALYEAIAQSPASFGIVAVEDDTVLGFVTFTTDVKALYKILLRKHGLKFAVLLAGKMLSPSRLKKIFETLFYPAKAETRDLPSAELLSVVVSPQARGKGLARKLIEEGLSQCRQRQIEKVKVLVADHNKPANKLYQTCGFEYATSVDSHGTKSNIYVADLTEN
ncbi:GNAT family N-acetyltransferase [Anaerohalosphaera lusitana]|nr:GNAT family N-acetyltransferase [Anaerohalosphaera lusitana]